MSTATAATYAATCSAAINGFVGNNGIALCSLFLAAATFAVNLYYKQKEHAIKNNQTDHSSANGAEPNGADYASPNDASLVSPATKLGGVRAASGVPSISTTDSKPVRKPRGRKPSEAVRGVSKSDGASGGQHGKSRAKHGGLGGGTKGAKGSATVDRSSRNKS